MNPHITLKEQQRIARQAAFWMLRKEGGLTPAVRRRYEAWLTLPHRADALRRMEAINQQMKQPWARRRLAIRLDPWNNPPPVPAPG